MKLVFPGGEHPPVLLESGVTTLGSDPQCMVRLDIPGIHPRHCELRLGDERVMLQVMPGAEVRVNDRDVEGLIALRPGDLMALAGVTVRLVALQATTTAGEPASVKSELDVGMTTVRPVLPRFALRGVSGTVLGRSFPLASVMTVGRAPDCLLQLDEPGLSRQHARLIPTADGVQIEDAGSTNGTFLNGKRIRSALAKPGDEIGFDTLRFRLIDTTRSELSQVAAPEERRHLPTPLWWWVGVAGIVAIVLWVLFGLR
jgi:hypothetical protein